MDKLAAMEVFTQVVNAGGFSAAARRMGLSRSAVSKHVADLEADLGVQLLFRTTRRMTPSEAGLAYVERCRAILAEIEETERAVSDAFHRCYVQQHVRDHEKGSTGRRCLCSRARVQFTSSSAR